MRYLYILPILFLFSGCSYKYSADKPFVTEVYDLIRYDQNIDNYAKNILDREELLSTQNEYEKSYFTPWNYNKVPTTLKEIMWPYESYKYGNKYGDNLQLVDQEWFDDMLENSNFFDYGKVSRKAITVKYSDLRNFPTNKPLFSDPSLAGEGFPFDYIQNSTIHANEPIYISHYSKDAAWAYVFTSYATGWISSDSLAYISDNQALKYIESKKIYITKDNLALKDENEQFLFHMKIGMLLPLIKIDKEFYTVLIIKSDKNANASFKRVKIEKNYASNEPLLLNKNNFTNIIGQLIDTHYGWGGLYGLRDCSSALKDIFSSFGIWLPRNSAQQSAVGKVISLENLDNDSKIAMIKEHGIAFETLLYKRGHIMLYVGTYDNQVMILHDTWGIKTIKDGIEGRKIIGKTVISTLNLGDKQPDFDENGRLLTNITSMNIVTFTDN